ncbi:tetrahydrofolylpolyglutamate synthase [Sclerotinia borealis F-4128]|uniref:Folylpolyglutamate synthase n=1 Tax=Sclerotinia borealis (strain F-4128) TaxID=1432307 RepID=W9CC75_SCLBF|nr:tetrahydrofolylpolyglutamate synthase [Sclerotinia borealis F-4128]
MPCQCFSSSQLHQIASTLGIKRAQGLYTLCCLGFACLDYHDTSIQKPGDDEDILGPHTTWGLQAEKCFRDLDALKCLNSLQTNPATVQKYRIASSPGLTSAKNSMIKWLDRIGYSTLELNRLNVIHIAGSKGKGSTCMYAESILSAHHRRYGFPQKIGLYTSPHLTSVRDRIRIDSHPISETLFAKYFFHVWNTLEAKKVGQERDKPAYFSFLTFLSFHIFLQEGVDAAIYEVGVGGENDATNVFSKPVVTGITTLGMDHVKRLGPNIDSIAWHKSGIFKSNCPSYSSVQVPEALQVLKDRAFQIGSDFKVVPLNPELPDLYTKVEAQRQNASLAVALTNKFLDLKAPTVLKPTRYDEILACTAEALRLTHIPGRLQLIQNGDQCWYLDGAHTPESLQVTAQWFAETAPSASRKALIFNHESERRSGKELLQVLHKYFKHANVKIDIAIFTANDLWADGTVKLDFVKRTEQPTSLGIQNDYKELWEQLEPQTQVVVTSSIEEALGLVREQGEMHILVTGDLHLVGGASFLIDMGAEETESLKDT